MDELHGRHYQRSEDEALYHQGKLVGHFPVKNQDFQHGIVVPTIPIRLVPGGKMPVRAHENDACLDCFCRLDEPMIIYPARPEKIPLGFCLNVPPGWEARLRSRSGVSLKGFRVHHGTIDPSFTDEVNVIVSLCYAHPLLVNPDERICQLTFAPVFRPRFEIVEDLPPCRGGFGSTGR